jgi:hypothetical protein
VGAKPFNFRLSTLAMGRMDLSQRRGRWQLPSAEREEMRRSVGCVTPDAASAGPSEALHFRQDIRELGLPCKQAWHRSMQAPKTCGLSDVQNYTSGTMSWLLNDRGCLQSQTLISWAYAQSAMTPA